MKLRSGIHKIVLLKEQRSQGQVSLHGIRCEPQYRSQFEFSPVVLADLGFCDGKVVPDIAARRRDCQSTQHFTDCPDKVPLFAQVGCESEVPVCRIGRSAESKLLAIPARLAANLGGAACFKPCLFKAAASAELEGAACMAR